MVIVIVPGQENLPDRVAGLLVLLPGIVVDSIDKQLGPRLLGEEGHPVVFQGLAVLRRGGIQQDLFIFEGDFALAASLPFTAGEISPHIVSKAHVHLAAGVEIRRNLS